MLNKWQDLNGRHKGEDVFIVGAGPQLGELTPNQLTRLAKIPAIGLNAVPHKTPTAYFLSGYTWMAELAMLAYRRWGVSESRLAINMQQNPLSATSRGAELEDGILRIQRKLFFGELPQRLTSPVLYTYRNGAIGATHLAYVMGARSITFVGVQMANGCHYYHEDTNTLTLLQADSKEVARSRGGSAMETVGERFSIARTLRGARTCSRGWFCPPYLMGSHAEVFTSYFHILSGRGVPIRVTSRDSLLGRCGAKYTSLQEALGV